MTDRENLQHPAVPENLAQNVPGSLPPADDPTQEESIHNVPLSPAQKILEVRNSEFQEVAIVEHTDYGRQLYLDGVLEISESDLEYNAANTYRLISRDTIEEVLILGGGDGGVLHTLLENGAGAVTMVEIDKVVVDMTGQYMKGQCGESFSSEKANLVFKDALQYLHDSEGANLDGIVYDLPPEPFRDDQSIEDFLDEIMIGAFKALKPGGTFSMQCCRASDSDKIDLISQKLNNYFSQVQHKIAYLPSYDPGDREWLFASAVNAA